MTGRLQVVSNGVWRSVCAGGISPAEVNVACRQLGFGLGTVMPVPETVDYSYSFYEPVDYEDPGISIRGFGCTGIEDRLADCNAGRILDYNTYDDSGCLRSGDAVVELACVSEADEGKAAER